MFHGIRTLKLWQIGVLAVVLVGAAGGTIWLYSQVSESGRTGLGDDQQLIHVQLGDLVNQVSIDGSLVFPNREILNFDTQGTVGKVMVEEGDTVKEGQPLARLDSTTVASLEKAVAQAQINLSNAEETLVEAKNPYTHLDKAKSESNVSNSKVSLEKAEEALKEAKIGPTEEDIAKAELSVTNSKVSLEKAEEALKEAKAGPTAEDISKVEMSVTNSKVSLEKAEEALKEAKAGSTAEDIAKAELSVTNAKVLLEKSEEALNEAKTGPAEEDIAKAELSVTNSKISLEKAEEALKEMEAGPTEDDITRATGQVDLANADLLVALEDLKEFQELKNDHIQQEQDAFDSALDGYKGIFTRWLGIELDEQELKSEPDTLLDTWGIDLASLFDKNLQFQDLNMSFMLEGPPPDDPATRWSETLVYAYMNLYPYSIIPICDVITSQILISSTTINVYQLEGIIRFVAPPATHPSGSTYTATVCIREEMYDAWLTYEKAEYDLSIAEIKAPGSNFTAEDRVVRARENLAAVQETLSDLKAGPDPLDVDIKKSQLQIAEAGLQKAQDDLKELLKGPDTLDIEAKGKQVAVSKTNLARAQDDLKELLNRPDALDIEVKEKQVTVSKTNLAGAQDDLKELLKGPDTLDIEVKEKQVAVSKTSLARAQDDLKELLKGPDTLDIEAKEKQLAVAQANLLETQETLVEIQGGVDPLYVALREADVTSVKLALENAIYRLENSTIKAPMMGTVSQVMIEADQSVNPNTPAVEIVDPTLVEVDGIVDEIDVLFIQEGARASVSMDALPGQLLDGTVSSISSAARSQQGVVNYPISIQVKLPQEVQLVEGLSATASIILREERQVLLIPLQALYGTFEKPFVRIMNNGSIQQRDIVLGNSDDFYVVVQEGLIEGDQIVMESSQAQTSQFGSFRTGGFGGRTGFPGGGIPRR